MNVIGYTRVSSDKQVKEGYSLEDQRALIEKWAADKGHTIVGWYTDEGESGSEGLDSRGGLAAAIDRVEVGDAQALVVLFFDRLARDLLLQLMIQHQLRSVGADVLSVQEPDIEGEPWVRDLFRNIMACFAEYNRMAIRSRMRAGAERAFAAGKVNAFGGRPPFGWRSERRELVPDPDEQAVLRWIFELRDDGLSYAAIAEQLNLEGFVRNRTGGAWHHEQVRRALKSRLAPEMAEVDGG